MKISEARLDFYDDVMTAWSPASRKTANSWLNRYLDRWLPEHAGVGVVAEMDIKEALDIKYLRLYKNMLLKRPVCPGTLKSAFFPLRGLAGHLVHKKYLVEDPTAGLTLPPRKPGTRMSVGNGTVCALMRAAELRYEARDVAFSRAIIATLTFTGVRAFELVKIRVDDISTADLRLVVPKGKGGQRRAPEKKRGGRSQNGRAAVTLRPGRFTWLVVWPACGGGSGRRPRSVRPWPEKHRRGLKRIIGACASATAQAADDPVGRLTTRLALLII